MIVTIDGPSRVKPFEYFIPIAQTISSAPATPSTIHATVALPANPMRHLSNTTLELVRRLQVTKPTNEPHIGSEQADEPGDGAKRQQAQSPCHAPYR